MTTRQVLDEIKALEPKERAKILGLLLEIEAAEKIAGLDEKAFDDAADRIINRHADLLQKLAK